MRGYWSPCAIPHLYTVFLINKTTALLVYFEIAIARFFFFFLVGGRGKEMFFWKDVLCPSHTLLSLAPGVSWVNMASQLQIVACCSPFCSVLCSHKPSLPCEAHLVVAAASSWAGCVHRIHCSEVWRVVCTSLVGVHLHCVVETGTISQVCCEWYARV